MPSSIFFQISFKHFNKGCRLFNGYAKLLLDSPESFSNSANEIEGQNQLRSIYDNGIALTQIIDNFAQTSMQERLVARKASPQFFDIEIVLHQELPLLRYWIKPQLIQLYIEIEEDLSQVYAQTIPCCGKFAPYYQDNRL